MEKVSSDRKSRRSRYFSTGRSRTTRRSQIFRCNHLLDFENFWKKVSDRKSRRWRYFSTGRSRTTRRSRIFRCNHLLDFENFWKKCPPTERAADRGFFPSDRREHSPGLGIFYRDRLFREEVTLQWKKRPVEGLFGRARSRSIRGRGISHREHLLDFENFSKFPVGRDTPRSGSPSTGRSRTTRRWRIFQRNHLLDFVKISKHFKVRSGKRFAHRGLVPTLGPSADSPMADLPA